MIRNQYKHISVDDDRCLAHIEFALDKEGIYDDSTWSIDDIVNLVPVDGMHKRLVSLSGTDAFRTALQLFLNAMVGIAFETNRAPDPGEKRERFVLEKSWHRGDYFFRAETPEPGR